MKKHNSQNNKIILQKNIKKIEKDKMNNLPLIKNDSMTNIKFVNEDNLRPDNLIPVKLSNDLKKGIVVKKNIQKLPMDEKSKVEGFINKRKRIHSANKFQNNLINHKNNNNNIIFNNNKLIIDNKFILKNRKNNFINDKRNNIIFNIQINQKISNKIKIGEPTGNHIKNNLIEQNNGIDNINVLNINKGEKKLKLRKNNLIHQNLNENKENEKIINQNKKDNDSYPKIIDYFYKEEKNQQFNEKMEDFILIKHPFLDIENNHLSLFAVFDGHGGEYVSQYLKENFCEFLKKTINSKYNSRFTQILKESMENIDKNFDNSEKAKQCGSTGTIVVVNNRNIYCANVGDSKCYYINENEAIQLTEDHNCTNKVEVDTLKSKGVAVFMGRVFGSLNLTRSFGDTEFKKDGITSTPYIKKIFSDKNDVKYLIIASDGIWDVVDNKTLFQISKELKEGTSEEFCNNLVNYALKNNSSDNISCIVIRFGNKN
jgi:serine/threonine protein phosphatase PrpC